MPGKPTFIMVKRAMADEYGPGFGGPSYCDMKKSMQDEHLTGHSDLMDRPVRLEADPKHKTTIKKLEKVAEGLHKASRTHAEQASTVEGVIQSLQRTAEPS